MSPTIDINRLPTRMPATDTEFVELSKAYLNAPISSLDSQALWLLVALNRHVPRQEWVGYIVTELLRGDTDAISGMGAFAHPVNAPSHGAVPGHPEWSYRFHGSGCCLTHKDGTDLDVDFNDGRSDCVDPYFYKRYLHTKPKPDLPESRLILQEPFDDLFLKVWDELKQSGYLSDDHQAHMLPTGKKTAQALDDWVARFEESENPWERTFMALAFNDFKLAKTLLPASRSAETNQLIDDLISDADLRTRAKLDDMGDVVTGERSQIRSVLLAKAHLGRKYVEEDIRRVLLRREIDGVTNTVLELIEFWRDSTFLNDLVMFLDRCKGGQIPIPTARTRACKLIMQYHHPSLMDESVRKALIRAFKRKGGTDAGTHGFMLYLLDPKAGLKQLKKDLSTKVPIARDEVCAALALIDTPEAMRILGNSKVDQAQMTLKLMNGITVEPPPEPEGELVELGGKKVRAYTMEETMRASSLSFLTYTIKSFAERFGPLKAAYEDSGS